MPREVRVQHWLATLPKDSSFRASLQRPLLVTPFRVPLKGDSFPSVGVSPEQRPGSFLRGIAGVLQPSQRGKTADRINQPVRRGTEPRAGRLGGVVWGGPQFSGWAVWDRPRVKRRGFGWADVTACRRGWGSGGGTKGVARL